MIEIELYPAKNITVETTCFPIFPFTNSYATEGEKRTPKIYTKTGDKGCILPLENIII